MSRCSHISDYRDHIQVVDYPGEEGRQSTVLISSHLISGSHVAEADAAKPCSRAGKQVAEQAAGRQTGQTADTRYSRTWDMGSGGDKCMHGA
jgi:hypothetical protein